MELTSLLFLAVGAWASAMVVALAVFTVAARQERDACDEETEVAIRLVKERFGNLS